MLDKLWGDEVNREGKKIREVIQQLQTQPGITYAPPIPPAPFSKAVAQDGPIEATPIESLTTFLNFCAGQYPAKHYMLFILGHGLVVGHDLFLYDEHAPKHSVSLNELGQALAGFKTQIGEAAFELISFHCCSMSSLEVADELQDTATYMLASQGPAFVGSWPYTQILIRLFNDLKKGAAETASDVSEMVRQMFSYVLDNNTDFMLAGYSFDLCLCDLSKFTTVEAPLEGLSAALVQGMADEMVKNCILLAHLQSQSYWQENYTDLYDFCFCLRRYCAQFGRATGNLRPYEKIYRACDRVIDALAEQSSERPDNPVCRAEFAGPDAQYSHGLSVYFPWSRPTADKTILRDYRNYRFASTGWLNFLDQYWGPESGSEVASSTMRPSHQDEMASLVPASALDELNEDMTSLMFAAAAPLSIDGGPGDSKVHPQDPTGDASPHGSKKNYVRNTQARQKRAGALAELSTDMANLMFTGAAPLNPNGLPQGPGKEGAQDPTGEASQRSSIKNFSRSTRAHQARASALDQLNEDMANLIFTAAILIDFPWSDKPNPQSSTGDASQHSSIKNYVRNTRARQKR